MLDQRPCSCPGCAEWAVITDATGRAWCLTCAPDLYQARTEEERASQMPSGPHPFFQEILEKFKQGKVRIGPKPDDTEMIAALKRHEARKAQSHGEIDLAEMAESILWRAR